MALLNLLQVFQSDDQTTFVDKISYNFDQILSLDGNIGATGFPGIQGVPGYQGIQGFQGIQGIDGTKWYAQPSSMPPSIPVPVNGDYWLQTDNQEIWQYISGIWTDTTYNLTSTGVFKQASQNIQFTNPNPNRSLVLSEIDYAGLDSPGVIDYKLKIVSDIDSPAIKFAVYDVFYTTNENPEYFHQSISVQKNILDYDNNQWQWNFNNPYGSTLFNSGGNSLFIKANSLDTVSPYSTLMINQFEFGTKLKFKTDATGRKSLLSFTDDLSSFQSGPDLFLIGLDNGIIPGSSGNLLPDNIFLTIRPGTNGVNHSFQYGNVSNSSIFSGSDFHHDSWEGQVSQIGGDNWWRLSGFNNDSNIESISYIHDKLTASGNVENSIIKQQYSINDVHQHFIGFTGGADTGHVLRPQIRMGYLADPLNPASSSNLIGYYFSADVWGRIGIGSDSFIKYYNRGGFQFNNKLTVEGEATGTSSTGESAWSGIHLIPYPTISNKQTVGITSGGIGGAGTDGYKTLAGLWFQESDPLALNLGMDIHFGTGISSGGRGAIHRYTIDRNGDHFFHNKSVSSADLHNLSIKIGGITSMDSSTTFGSPIGHTYPNDHISIESYSQADSKYKNIVFSRGTTIGGIGGGFFGIGQNFGEVLNPGDVLQPGQWYMGNTSTPVTYNGVLYPVQVPIQGTGATLSGSGSVTQAIPSTKFHATESFTFGTRDVITNYNIFGDVGINSFTVGTKHKAPGFFATILGGTGHTASNINSMIIGYDGSTPLTNSLANSIAIGTTISLSKGIITGSGISGNTRFKRSYSIPTELGTSDAQRENLLNLTLDKSIGPNGIEITQINGVVSQALPIITNSPAKGAIPFLISNNTLISTNQTLFQISGITNSYGSTLENAVNISINGDPFTVPSGINYNTIFSSTLGSAATAGPIPYSNVSNRLGINGWNNIPSGTWWFGKETSVGTISDAAISIKQNGGIVFELSDNFNRGNSNPFVGGPRLSLSNHTYDNGYNHSIFAGHLGIFAGILHSTATTNAGATLKAADIVITGGESFVSGRTLSGSDLAIGGDVYISGGKASDASGISSYTKNGNVIIGFDPYEQVQRGNVEINGGNVEINGGTVEVLGDVQMLGVPTYYSTHPATLSTGIIGGSTTYDRVCNIAIDPSASTVGLMVFHLDSPTDTPGTGVIVGWFKTASNTTANLTIFIPAGYKIYSTLSSGTMAGAYITFTKVGK